jgi:hypothetical protein
MGILRFSRTILLTTTFLTPTTVAAEGALALLDGETDGFAIDATSYDSVTAAAYTGGPVGGTVAVIDTGTPANDLSNVALDSSNLVQSGTSPKMVHFPTSPYVRWSAHNLIFRSQEFDNAFWTDSSISETANDTTAPDGTSTADKLVPAAASAAHFVSNGNPNETAIPVGGAVYTASVYAKAAGYNFVLVNFNSNGTDFGVVYDLSDGSFEGNRSGTTPAATTIEDAGNGWWRIGVSGVGTNLGSIAILVGSSASEAINISSWTANGTDGIHVWGAQINRGYIPTPYLVTTTAARIGIPQSYDVAAAKYGILVEPAATNLVLRSGELDNASWTKANATATDGATAPDASTTADTLQASTTGAGRRAHQNVTTTSGQPYSLSVYLKAGTSNWALIDLNDASDDAAGTYVNLGTGAIGSAYAVGTWTASNRTITAIGNGWYRVSFNTTVNVTTTNVAVNVVDGDASTTATAGANILVWGAQSESGTTVTSFTPTLGSTVTRAVDVISLDTSLIPLSTTVGTVYVDCLDLADFTTAWQIDDGTTGDRLRVERNTTADFIVTDGGVIQSAENIGAWAFDTRVQISTAWAANDFDSSINGGALASDATGTIPTGLVAMRIGHNIGGGNPFKGLIYRLIYVPRQVQTASGNLLTWRYNF